MKAAAGKHECKVAPATEVKSHGIHFITWSIFSHWEWSVSRSIHFVFPFCLYVLTFSSDVLMICFPFFPRQFFCCSLTESICLSTTPHVRIVWHRLASAGSNRMESRMILLTIMNVCRLIWQFVLQEVQDERPVMGDEMLPAIVLVT